MILYPLLSCYLKIYVKTKNWLQTEKSVTELYIATFQIPYLQQYMACVETSAPSKRRTA